MALASEFIGTYMLVVTVGPSLCAQGSEVRVSVFRAASWVLQRTAKRGS